jgi:hypothetical protein
LTEGKNHFGTYIECLQCSYYLTAEEEAVLHVTGKAPAPTKARPSAKPKTAKQA